MRVTSAKRSSAETGRPRRAVLGLLVAMLWGATVVAVLSPSIRARFGLEHPESWRILRKAPVALARHTAVWTGTSMIVWGSTSSGVDDCEIDGEAGALYDPSSDTWSRMLKAPLAPREGHSAVWTGDEMIVWGGYLPCYGDTRFDDGAAFDPRTLQWRRVARSPLAKRGGHVAVWTGTEMLVWGSGPGAAAYDPQRDAWRRIASPLDRGGADAFVVGDDVVVWSVTEASDGDVPTRSRGSVYSITRDRWRRIDGTAFGRFGPVWTGRELIVPNLDPTRAPRDAQGGRVRHGAYDPRTDRWRSIPAGPKLRTFEQGSFVSGDLGLWTGREAIFWGDDALAFDPSRNVWRVMTEPPRDCRAAPAIWTGHEMIVWRGVHGGASYQTFGDGIAYTPPSDPARPRVAGRSTRPSPTAEPWELDEFGDPGRFDYRCGVPG